MGGEAGAFGGQDLVRLQLLRERDPKIPIFELLNFKESLLLRKDKDSFNLKTLTKKRVNTNRVLTEKVPPSARRTRTPRTPSTNARASIRYS